MPSPFNGRTFTFTQPDGSPIQVRGWGDQNYAVFETLDGYTLTKNPATGYFEVASVSADGHALQPAALPGRALDGAAAGLARGVRVRRESAMAAGRASALSVAGRRCDQRRRERRAALSALRAAAAAGGPLLAPPQRATVGDFIGLCLLVDFSDAPATILRDEVDRFCNQPGYSGFGNKGSVFDYYRDNSIGRCRYTNIVAPYFRALHPKSYYTDPQIEQPQRAIELINEALAHHKAAGFDFTPLSADTQGFVYALNVFYAGPVMNNWAEGLWPHSHHLGSQVNVAPGKAAFDYQITAIGNELSLGTFCHENGHMLCDYPDLYDYGYESSGVGAFCLMCAGPNVDEKNPVQVSAYLKRMSGWANTVTPLTHGLQLALAAGSNDFAIYSRGGREYFLLENRRRTGRDAALPDEGLAIWHVDESGDNSHEQMTADSHYELSLMQADGLFQLERQRGHMGDVNDLYAGGTARFADNTVPSSKWWNGSSSNLSIDQVSAPGAVITLRSLIGDVATPPQVLSKVSNPDRAVPDNDPAGISDRIDVAEAVTISSLRVGVDISHTYRGDLRVTLTPPGGAAIELQPKGQGGNAHDLKLSFDESTLPALSTLRGRSTQGGWTLTVQDLAPADNGRLNQWSLDFGAANPTQAPVELKEAPGIGIPDAAPAGIERVLATGSPIQVGALEVAVDIAHTWIGDLRVTLFSPAGTAVVLHDATGGSQHDLVRTYTGTTTPALATLVGQPAAGSWRLRVVDGAAQDIGKLNSWKLLIKPQP
jgi:M6 family metalloprotease-like protein